MMKSYPVAKSGIKAMLRGKPNKNPGIMNAITIFSIRFIPRRLQSVLGNFVMRGGMI